MVIHIYFIGDTHVSNAKNYTKEQRLNDFVQGTIREGVKDVRIYAQGKPELSVINSLPASKKAMLLEAYNSLDDADKGNIAALISALLDMVDSAPKTGHGRAKRVDLNQLLEFQAQINDDVSTVKDAGDGKGKLNYNLRLFASGFVRDYKVSQQTYNKWLAVDGNAARVIAFNEKYMRQYLADGNASEAFKKQAEKVGFDIQMYVNNDDYTPLSEAEISEGKTLYDVLLRTISANTSKARSVLKEYASDDCEFRAVALDDSNNLTIVKE